MVPFEILRLTYSDLGALEREIATNIRYGRVFVGEVLDVPVLTDGDLVIVHPVHGRELRLAAQVVMVNYDGPMRGTGIALRSFGPSEVERVQAFARDVLENEAPPPPEEPRSRQQTPQPQPRPRQPTPGALPITQPEVRPRQATPMPMTLSDRPRRGTPDPRSEAVTVRPDGPMAGTVPPAAPENDWSDLHSSEFTRLQTPPPPRSEIPAALRSEAAPASRAAITAASRSVLPAASLSEIPAALRSGRPTPSPRLEIDASPQPSAAGDEDWSDFAGPDAEADAAALLESPLATPADEPAEAELEAAAPLDPAEEIAAADSGDAEADADLEPAQPPVAEEDWSDVAAAIAAPAAPRTAAAAPVAQRTAAAAPDPTLAEPDDCEAAEEAEASDEEAGADEAAFDEEPSTGAAPAPTELQSENRQVRLRTLNAVEQLKVARRGELSDRIVVERLYGKQVWEALLQNPRITLPEVARIARKGTVPRPLIEQILDNAMWAKEPNIRRALLSNPKLTSDGILKLLRMTPKHELKVMEKATAFPLSVRDAARKLLREGAQ